MRSRRRWWLRIAAPRSARAPHHRAERDRAGAVNAAELTLAMIERRQLDVVLLAKREKKPPAGRRWQVTHDRRVAERHLRGGGNLGLIAGEKNAIAILDPDEQLCWADMIDSLGQPCAPWVETGRGRRHYYVA